MPRGWHWAGPTKAFVVCLIVTGSLKFLSRQNWLFSCKTVLLSSAEVRLKQASGTKWKILQ